MDLSRYEFDCQKAFHQGLQLARGLGHSTLEVEHVALAVLRSSASPYQKNSETQLRQVVEQDLRNQPKILGRIKVAFGRRLDAALDGAEAASGDNLVGVRLLWRYLERESTPLKIFAAKTADERGRTRGNQSVHEDIRKSSQRTSSGAPTSKARSTSSTSHHQSAADSSLDGERNGLKANGTRPNSFSPKRQQKSGDFHLAPDSEQDGYLADEDEAQALPKILQTYTIDLTSKAEGGDLDPVIGRDIEVRRVMEVLGRKKKNNPLLIGEAGVGKSAIAEALAIRIAGGDVPSSMMHQRVLSLDLGRLLAGSKYRGEFEDRVSKILDAIRDTSGKVILFIDEIHMMVGAGQHEGGTDAANLFKPALARGEIRCLGATTLDEFRRHIEKDPALERRFQTLHVAEPDAATALSILKGLKRHYEHHHGVDIADQALSAAIELSQRFVPARKLPDKAIDLIDEAASRLRLRIDSVPGLLRDLEEEFQKVATERQGVQKEASQSVTLQQLDDSIAKLATERSALEQGWRSHQGLLRDLKEREKSLEEAEELLKSSKKAGNYELASQVQHDQIPKITGEVAGDHQKIAELLRCHPHLSQTVGESEIAAVVADWTGIPLGRLREGEAKRLATIDSRLHQRVFGQERAVSTIAKAVKRGRVGISDPSRPLGVFLFLGPTGVGKTETAKALAEEVFQSEDHILRIDMSEFMEQHSVARLIGSPPGYVGHGEGGALTEPVRRRPYQVILLDEIEKAHPRVLDLLLQVFDDGHLTDAAGRQADFRQSLIILTSNLLQQRPGHVTADREEEWLRQELAKHLRPEFIGRLDEVVMFHRLGTRHHEELLERQVRELNRRLTAKGLRINLGDLLRQKLLKVAAGLSQGGGRDLKRSFQTIVTDSLAEELLTRDEPMVGVWLAEIDKDGHLQWQAEFEKHKYLPAAT